MFSLIRVAMVMVARHSYRKPNQDSYLLQSPVLNPWPPALCGTVLRMCKLHEKWGLIGRSESLGVYPWGWKTVSYHRSILSFCFLIHMRKISPSTAGFWCQHVFITDPASPGAKDHALKTWKTWLKTIPSMLNLLYRLQLCQKKKRKRKTQTPIIWLGTEIIASLGTPSPHFYHQCRKVSSQTCQLLSSSIRY